jgi:hypothetical protein
MNSRNRMHLVMATLALILGSAVAHAHNGVEHIMGSVTALTDSSITVDTVKHTAVTVLVDPETKFMKNSAPVSPKNLKVGDRVAIDAKENSDKKLVGVTVKLGATTGVEHGEHKH